MQIHSAQELVIADAQTETYACAPDAEFPNSAWPVLLHRAALRLAQRGDPAAAVEQLFAGNHWRGSWRDTLYSYHHYHSTAHEVLGCFQGRGRIKVGGQSGHLVELAPGDVLVLPAGTAHCLMWEVDSFQVVGAYAAGRSYDVCRGDNCERTIAEENIRNVPRPQADPVHGTHGPLMQLWGGA